MSTSASTDPAFRRLFDSTFDRAVEFAKRLVWDPAWAEDLVTEAFARAAYQWDDVKVHPSPDAWILRQTASLTLDQLRRRRGRRPGPDGHVVNPLADERRQQLVDALDRLTRRRREVVVLRYLADLDEIDVAEVLEVPAAAVRADLDAAMATLRTDLLGSRPQVQVGTGAGT